MATVVPSEPPLPTPTIAVSPQTAAAGGSMLEPRWAYVGIFLVALVTSNRVMDMNPAGIIGSIIGALLVLFLVGRFGARRAVL